MSLLYPRLLPAETEVLFARLPLAISEETPSDTRFGSSRIVYAASGGLRASSDHLLALRNEIVQHAEQRGYPDRASPDDRNSFDRSVARVLHRKMNIAPGEASQRQVWAHLALVLLPDVCAWRFPPTDGDRYVADRFKGTDLTRHALARLWWRAQVLKEPGPVEDPYWLLDVLGEADLDQVMARRRSVAASPALVRAIVRVTAESEDDGGRAVLRDLLKRLLRLTAFIDLDWLEESYLEALVRRERQASITNLTP